MEELFKISEEVLEGKRDFSELLNFPESLQERRPVENPLKRSALIVSGDRIDHVKKALLRPADVVIFNVEDGVSEDRKEFARWFLRKFLINTPFDGSKEVVLRINPVDSKHFWEDITVLLPVVPHAVRLSKVKGPEDVLTLDSIITAFELSKGIERNFIKIQLSIETPEAVNKLLDILSSSERINAVYLGILDLFSELSLSQRLSQGDLGRFIREKFVFESRSKGIHPIAPAFQDYENLKGFEDEAEKEREIGFSGKMCISVRQVEVANRVFSPSREEIEEAMEIVEVYEGALKEGKGGVPYKGKFIDQPIYKGALNLLRYAGISGEGFPK